MQEEALEVVRDAAHDPLARVVLRAQDARDQGRERGDGDEGQHRPGETRGDGAHAPPTIPVDLEERDRAMADSSGARALDHLDSVAVRIAHEADPRAALAQAVRRLLGLDALLGEVRQRGVQIVDGQRDVVVARAEVVGVDAVVVGQLERGRRRRAGP